MEIRSEHRRGQRQATAPLLVAENAQVVFTDIQQDKGQAVAQCLGANATTA
jgi:hypothetical protein